MRYKYATLSLPGTREINEDSIAVKESNGKLILVVADGLGGHDKGEVASKIVAETIIEKGTLVKLLWIWNGISSNWYNISNETLYVTK